MRSVPGDHALILSIVFPFKGDLAVPARQYVPLVTIGIALE